TRGRRLRPRSLAAQHDRGKAMKPSSIFFVLCLCAIPTVATAESKGRLPLQFTGCYRTPDWVESEPACRQPTKEEMKARDCPGGGILVDSDKWTTFEDWTCTIDSIAKRDERLLVTQTCGGEGRYQRIQELWQLRNVVGLVLL